MVTKERTSMLVAALPLVVAFVLPATSAGAAATVGTPPSGALGGSPPATVAKEAGKAAPQIRSARIRGTRLRLALVCGESGRLTVRAGKHLPSPAVPLACRGGRAAVATPLPAGATSHGRARAGLVLDLVVRVGARRSHMTLHLNAPRKRAHAANWSFSGTYCDQRLPLGGGGQQSVSNSMINTFGLGMGQAIYTRAWIRPWTASSGTGAWIGSSTLIWYVPVYGGWAAGDGRYYYNADGTSTTYYGRSSADGNVFYHKWDGWNFKSFAAGTFTQAGLEAWTYGMTPAQHRFDFVTPWGPAAYDNSWCRFR